MPRLELACVGAMGLPQPPDERRTHVALEWSVGEAVTIFPCTGDFLTGAGGDVSRIRLAAIGVSFVDFRLGLWVEMPGITL